MLKLDLEDAAHRLENEEKVKNMLMVEVEKLENDNAIVVKERDEYRGMYERKEKECNQLARRIDEMKGQEEVKEEEMLSKVTVIKGGRYSSSKIDLNSSVHFSRPSHPRRTRFDSPTKQDLNFDTPKHFSHTLNSDLEDF
jgi:hypothetical protein